MTVQLSLDDFQRLTCELSDTGARAIVTASDTSLACKGLLAALAAVRSTGNGECYWNEVAGQYRWVLRRIADDTVRVAIQWSMGTVTGWEHAFWTETSLDEFCTDVESQLDRLC